MPDPWSTMKYVPLGSGWEGIIVPFGTHTRATLKLGVAMMFFILCSSEKSRSDKSEILLMINGNGGFFNMKLWRIVFNQRSARLYILKAFENNLSFKTEAFFRSVRLFHS